MKVHIAINPSGPVWRLNLQPSWADDYCDDCALIQRAIDGVYEIYPGRDIVDIQEDVLLPKALD